MITLGRRKTIAATAVVLFGLLLPAPRTCAR